MVVCDVDGLKAINDSDGHPAGDRALRRVAEALRIAAEEVPGSAVGRLSGDEFCVVLDGHGPETAAQVSGVVLDLLESVDGVRLSVSFGAATVQAGACASPDQLLSAADTAQYAAKRRGGGMLCTTGTDVVKVRRPRRSGTRSIEQALAAETEAVLETLDGPLAQAMVLDRLEALHLTSYSENLS